MSRWSTRVALLLLLIGQMSAGPVTSGSVCHQQNSLHERMDTVEQRLEEAVHTLESDVSLLLEALEAPDWSPLLDTPTTDILDTPPS